MYIMGFIDCRGLLRIINHSLKKSFLHMRISFFFFHLVKGTFLVSLQNVYLSWVFLCVCLFLFFCVFFWGGGGGYH